MTVRAKFRVTRIESVEGVGRGPDFEGKPTYFPTELRTIVLIPVSYTGDPDSENSRFWSASPSGEIRLGTINEEAWKEFELRGEYYVDFVRVS